MFAFVIHVDTHAPRHACEHTHHVRPGQHRLPRDRVGRQGSPDSLGEWNPPRSHTKSNAGRRHDDADDDGEGPEEDEADNNDEDVANATENEDTGDGNAGEGHADVHDEVDEDGPPYSAEDADEGDEYGDAPDLANDDDDDYEDDDDGGAGVGMEHDDGRPAAEEGDDEADCMALLAENQD